MEKQPTQIALLAESKGNPRQPVDFDIKGRRLPVKSGQWSKKTKENLQCLFGKHVVPIIGQQAPREVPLTSLQLLVNKMAEDGYRKSAVGFAQPIANPTWLSIARPV